MLVLEPKKDTQFRLTDEVSGAVIVIKTFLRRNGNLALGFDAPKTVRIIREKYSPLQNSRGVRKADICASPLG